MFQKTVLLAPEELHGMKIDSNHSANQQNHSHKNRNLALHLVSALFSLGRYDDGDPGIEGKLFLLLVRTLVFPACSSVNNHHRSILMLVCYLGWQQEVCPEGSGTSFLEKTGFILV